MDSVWLAWLREKSFNYIEYYCVATDHALNDFELTLPSLCYHYKHTYRCGVYTFCRLTLRVRVNCIVHEHCERWTSCKPSCRVLAHFEIHRKSLVFFFAHATDSNESTTLRPNDLIGRMYGNYHWIWVIIGFSVEKKNTE